MKQTLINKISPFIDVDNVDQSVNGLIEIIDTTAIEFYEWLKSTKMVDVDIPSQVKLKMFKNQKGL